MSKIKPSDFIERNDFRAFLSILRDWSAIFVVSAFSIWADNFFVYLVSVWIIGVFQFAVGEALLHEAAHYNLFKKKSWNENLDFLYGLPILMTVEQFQADHFPHHKYQGSPKDYVWEAYEFLGFTESTKNLFFLWFVKPIIGFAIFYFLKFLSLRPLKSGVKLVTFWLVVILAFSMSGNLDILILYWFVPLLWCYASFLYWFEVTEHYNTQSGSRSKVDFLTNLLFHNFGYHRVHHLCPKIPWYRLREAHDVFCNDDLDISYSFFDTYRQLKTKHQEAKAES